MAYKLQLPALEDAVCRFLVASSAPNFAADPLQPGWPQGPAVGQQPNKQPLFTWELLHSSVFSERVLDAAGVAPARRLHVPNMGAAAAGPILPVATAAAAAAGSAAGKEAFIRSKLTKHFSFVPRQGACQLAPMELHPNDQEPITFAAELQDNLLHLKKGEMVEVTLDLFETGQMHLKGRHFGGDMPTITVDVAMSIGARP